MKKNVEPNVEHIEIGDKGVKSVLKKYKPEQSIAEYIWNGFDANATTVDVYYESNDLDGIEKIIIEDNGDGISHETLRQKFKPFFESAKEKKDNRHSSLPHGRKGVGRLTFFTFANKTTWSTRYKKNGDILEYNIGVTAESLKNYSGNKTTPKKSDKSQTGTTVVFEGIRDIEAALVEKYLKQAFGWFLELNKGKGLSLKINGHELDYESIIGERDTTVFKHGKATFDVSFVRWNDHLQTEYSRYYLMDSKHSEIWKDTTKLNKKGDGFYHSVYIKSKYFDEFSFYKKQGEVEQEVSGNSNNDEEYKFLEEELVNYLRKKRNPFLKELANKLIEEYNRAGVMPTFSDEVWEQTRKTELEEIVKGLYKVQPKIFTSSSPEQKKTFVRFLNALLESDERDQILEIVNEIVDLDPNEREELLKLLQSTKLSGIIRTIKLITDRYKIVDQLKELVFNKDLKANERDHLQPMIDENYWIFGEQFHLVTSTEAKFEKVLHEYLYLLRGEKKKVKIDHPDKNKEMDIFLCRQNKLIDTIENVVVELKSPSINLGKKEVDQVIEYMQVILAQPEFNANNMTWEFFLVGNTFDTSKWIEQLIKTNEPHGEAKKGLVHSVDKYKIYVRTWSEIFTDFECRHKFLEERLKLDRDSLSKKYASADEIVSGKL